MGIKVFIQNLSANTMFVPPSLHTEQAIAVESCHVCELLFRTVIEASAPDLPITWDLGVRIFIIICGIVVNLKFLRNLSHDRHNIPVGKDGNLLEPHMTIYANCQTILWPLILIFTWTIKGEFLNLTAFPTWCCLVLYFIIRTFRTYLACNSIVSAFIRLSFVVYEAEVIQFGKDRIKKFFLFGSMLIPLFISILLSFVSANIFNLSNLATVTQSSEFSEPAYNSTVLSKELNINQTCRHPFYTFSINHLPIWLVSSVYYICIAILVAMLSNIVEGFVYCTIFSYVRR